MKIVVTGTSSGLGAGLISRLSQHDVTALTRSQLELSNIDQVQNYDIGIYDILINCAGTGRGGKINFVEHASEDIVDIVHVNLLAPMLLTKKALQANPRCRIVNITSTNNNRYYANDLAYSLSKQSLSVFGAMLRVEYPNVDLLEVRLGLVKTNFNANRYVNDQHRFSDIYFNPHLSVEQAVDRIMPVLFDPTIKFIEVGP